MDNYTFREYAALYLILGEAPGNGSVAVWLYAERCSQRLPQNLARFSSSIASAVKPMFTILRQTVEDREVHEQLMGKGVY
jgi:hypothetical protein